MARNKRNFGEIFTTVIIGAGTLGVGALIVDWMKATGKWPGSPKMVPEAALSGEDSVLAAAQGFRD